MADPIWFWQRIVSPHMAELAKALAGKGRQVTYVAEQEMSPARLAQGWRAPALGDAQLRFAPSEGAVRELVQAAPPTSIHICQGFRGNGLVNTARIALRARELRQWVIMEGVADAGWRGYLKRLEYRRLIRSWRWHMEGVLAIGHATPAWLARRGMPQQRTFPFAYFLREPAVQQIAPVVSTRPFQLLFVGRLVDLKRVDLLFEALRTQPEETFELTIIGKGPSEASLRSAAEQKLPGRVTWLGSKSIDEMPVLMSQADCLILPSSHDGWGAVVSEALMVGTPVICSGACGAAGVVRASGQGGVFRTGDRAALSGLLDHAIAAGRQTHERRRHLAAWAQCLGAGAGARYLDEILTFADGQGTAPKAPWLAADPVLGRPAGQP